MRINEAKRPANGRRSRGRPFKPGQSGNPGGRPKGAKTYAIRELVAQALAAVERGSAWACRGRPGELNPTDTTVGGGSMPENGALLAVLIIECRS